MLTVLDTETADLQGGVCQIGKLVAGDDLNIVDQKEDLIKPSRPISPSSMGVHFIRDDHVENSPSLESVIEDYLPSQGYLIGHNISFDIRAIEESLSEAPEEVLIVKEGVRILDTLTLARELYKKSEVGDHKNTTLYHFFEGWKHLEYEGEAHNALFDCHLTFIVLKEILERNNLTLDAAWKLCNADIQDRVCTMKKYRGKDMTWQQVIDQDKSYCEWLYNNYNFEYYTRGNEVKDWLKEIFEEGE